MAVPTMTRGRLGSLAGVALGAGGGLAWGVAARLWMRLIAEDPEFSWSGTLFIVGAATIAGTGLGLAAVARSSRWRFRRALSVAGGVMVIPLGAGAGSILLVSAVLGGLVLGRPRLGWPVRAAIAALAGLTLVAAAGLPQVPALIGAAAIGGLLIAGYRARLVVALLALVPAALVLWGVLTSDLPLWQRLAGSAAYPLLLGVVTVWLGRAMAPLEATS